MHGMVDFTMAETEKEQTNGKLKIHFKNDKDSIRKYFYIAMMVLITIIAIILVDLIRKNNKNIIGVGIAARNNAKSIDVKPTEDYDLYKFIDDYLKARTNLDYPKIFSSFGRDYYKEEREDRDGTFKKTIDSIRYERIFVRSYDNIKVYADNGFYDGDVICIVTYDMNLGFTDDKAPMIIIFYLEKDGNSYIIKENLDVGISKYIVEVTNTDTVKKIYDDVYTRLNRALVSNESLKLVYNSLRQFEMNMSSDLGPLNKLEMIENIGVKKLDLIEDADKIANDIKNAKEEAEKEKLLNEYIERVIASLSDAQRAY